MKTFLTTLVLICACFVGKTSACSCIFIPDFCQTITFGNNGAIPAYLHIYYVKVATQSASGMKVNILKTYHGEDLTGHPIFITSGDGANCNVITSQFAVGEEMIIAAAKNEDQWSLSECGVSHLKVENGQVLGQITPTITQLPLNQFPFLNGCGSLNPTPTEEPTGSVPFIVGPSLTDQQVRIATKGVATTDLKVRVFDLTGRLVLETTVPKEAAFYGQQIPIGEWSKGLYFFSLEAAGRRETFKVVKMDR